MRGASPVDHKLGGVHISGSERIINEDTLKEEVLSLIDRAFNHPKGKSDFINISIQKIHDKSQISYIDSLPIKTLSKNKDNNPPKEILKLLGFSEDKITYALDLLFKLKNLKGALIVSFDDLYEFKDHIVRCTNMDYDSSIKDELEKFLDDNNFLGKIFKRCFSIKL